jgi:hypothetical protein
VTNSHFQSPQRSIPALRRAGRAAARWRAEFPPRRKVAPPEHPEGSTVLYRQISEIPLKTPESVMSEPRHTDPLRRLNLQAAARTSARTTGATAMMWTTLWTWLAAIAAAVVVLGLVFGYSRSDVARNQPGEPTTTGSAAGSAPAAPPLSAPRLGETHAPAADNQ